MLSGLVFDVFILLGMWRPLSWQSKWKQFFYSIHTVICVTVSTLFTFALLMYFLQAKGDIVDITLSLLNFSAFFTIWIKKITIIIRRKIILDTRNIFMNELCQPRDAHESKILLKYLHLTRIITNSFLTMTSLNAALLILVPLIKNNISLPVQMWTPYNLNSKQTFTFTYLCQSVVIIMASLATASVECLAFTVMILLCAQLEILAHRFQILPKSRRTNYLDSISDKCEIKLKDCVRHHLCLYSLGDKLNELFGSIISLQFISSLLQLCTLIYQLSKLNSSDHNFWSTLSLLCASSLQIYLYCIAGEKIMEKSLSITEAVYQVKWTVINSRMRKDLIIVMMKASRPIKLIGSSIIVMQIDTFVKVLKSAFSAYNLLINL